MNDYTMLAGLSFGAIVLSGLWPKACLAKMPELLKKKGEDPNQPYGPRKMKELDPKLYRSWKTGFIISSVFAILFILFALLAFLK